MTKRSVKNSWFLFFVAVSIRNNNLYFVENTNYELKRTNQQRYKSSDEG